MAGEEDTGPQNLDTYRSYLVRIWKDGACALWRASAQSVQTGETIYFASISALFAFLEAQAEERDEE